MLSWFFCFVEKCKGCLPLLTPRVIGLGLGMGWLGYEFDNKDNSSLNLSQSIKMLKSSKQKQCERSTSFEPNSGSWIKVFLLSRFCTVLKNVVPS